MSSPSIATSPSGPSFPRMPLNIPRTASSPYRDIISYSSATKWYSPGAQGQAAEHADHCLLAYIKRRGQPELLDNLWLTCFLKVHNLALRLKGPETPQPWIFPIASISGSSGLGWRAGVVKGDGNSVGDLLSLESAQGGCLDITLLDVAGWDSRVVECRSPFWSWRASPEAGGRKVLGVHTEAMGPLESLLVVGERHGFWRCSMVELKKIAKLAGQDLDHCADEFNLCWRLVAAVLETSDEEELLKCMHERLRSMRTTTAAPKAFLDFQETEHIMNIEDADDYKKVQQNHKAKQSQMQEFLQPYKAQRRQVSVARAKAAAVAAARGRGGGRRGRGQAQGGHPWRAQTWQAPIIGETIAQLEATHHLPPTCSIWESRTRLVGAWNGHCPPTPRVSSSDTLAGSHAVVAFDVIKQLWELYLRPRYGLLRVPCPGLGIAVSVAPPDFCLSELDRVAT